MDRTDKITLLCVTSGAFMSCLPWWWVQGIGTVMVLGIFAYLFGSIFWFCGLRIRNRIKQGSSK